VDLFKAMLSEVKIMIYLGESENVLKLHGVCTREIKNRNIHIILELCENGSLDSYLRKNRKVFVNLLETSQQAGGRGESSSSQARRLSTLDLIRWSGEIAKGMHHLRMKGVSLDCNF
jgi:serine/threonine protein kinase